MKIPVTNLSYVELYAKKLKKGKSFFNQQKKLIESQLYSSSSVFVNMFLEKKDLKGVMNAN